MLALSIAASPSPNAIESLQSSAATLIASLLRLSSCYRTDIHTDCAPSTPLGRLRRNYTFSTKTTWNLNDIVREIKLTLYEIIHVRRSLWQRSHWSQAAVARLTVDYGGAIRERWEHLLIIEWLVLPILIISFNISFLASVRRSLLISHAFRGWIQHTCCRKVNFN